MSDEAAVAVVILTMGDRPAELRRAVDSALGQRDVDVRVVVVANGADERAVASTVEAPGVSIVAVAENLGIPGGRNLGAATTWSPFVAFLDDDATVVDAGALARAAADFAADDRLAVVALHIVDPQGHTARRHVPRLGRGDADRSGRVTAFLGGACVVRRAAWDDVGGYAAEFVYAMEETDLALRLADRGWTMRYDGTPAVEHPASEPSRHPGAAARTMRNRVWLAHRNLPVPLAVAYVAIWTAATTARAPRAAPSLPGVIVDAWRTRPGPRRPIAWRTAWRLTRWGRPPIL